METRGTSPQWPPGASSSSLSKQNTPTTTGCRNGWPGSTTSSRHFIWIVSSWAGTSSAISGFGTGMLSPPTSVKCCSTRGPFPGRTSTAVDSKAWCGDTSRATGTTPSRSTKCSRWSSCIACSSMQIDRAFPQDGSQLLFPCTSRNSSGSRTMNRNSAWILLPGAAVLPLLLSLAFPSAALAQTVSFIARRDFTAGYDPISVAVGDFNGDGVPDLVVADRVSNNVSVLLGNGDGTFQTPVAFATGTRPQSVAVGDFNGDGKLDLVVANEGSNNVSVLLGNGDGAFQAAQNFPAGTNPQSVAVGDFNGDGKLDLAVANEGSGDVSVLLGNGDGTLQTAVAIT